MEFKKDLSIGVIPVYKSPDGENYFCIVQNFNEHWGFPKGHPDLNESEIMTAKRELEEETGITDVILNTEKIFTEQYFSDGRMGKRDKTVKYFIGNVANMNSQTPPEFKNEITGLKWLTFSDALQQLTYDDAKTMLKEVNEYIN